MNPTDGSSPNMMRAVDTSELRLRIEAAALDVAYAFNDFEDAKARHRELLRELHLRYERDIPKNV